jgi:hypothetical protein
MLPHRCGLKADIKGGPGRWSYPHAIVQDLVAR